jgi:hypothetical protein
VNLEIHAAAAARQDAFLGRGAGRPHRVTAEGIRSQVAKIIYHLDIVSV